MPKKTPNRKSITVKFLPDELSFILKQTNGMPVATYIRESVLQNYAQVKTRVRGKFPVKDYTALGNILALLGRSQIAKNLTIIAKAINIGSIVVSPETEILIQQACKAIIKIRVLLITALGLGE